MPSPLMFWIFVWIMFAAGFVVGYNWHKRKLEEEIEAVRKLAHDYITAYEKLAFGNPFTGDDGNCFFCSETDCHNECLTETTGGGDE